MKACLRPDGFSCQFAHLLLPSLCDRDWRIYVGTARSTDGFEVGLVAALCVFRASSK